MNLSYLQILQRLVAFPTVSARSNLGLIDWVRDYLDGQGISSHLSFNTERTKANLFATIGSGAPGGLLLSGHSDVVPVEGQAWSLDPFTATIKDGRVYGRGTCDMKGFIAVALSLVPEFARDATGSPIHLAFTFDEEVGCLGVAPLLADLSARDVRPSSCVVGEPTGMGVVVAQKGAGMYACEVTGLECHSSLAPKGVNAIHYAAKIIANLDELAAELVRGERPHPGFDIPHSTMQVNTIRGGTAGNTVAGSCRFTIDIRHLPCTKREEVIAALNVRIADVVLPAMRRVAPQASVEITELAYVPAFSIPESDTLVRQVQAATHSDGCSCAPFGTEAGHFERAGIKTLVCGPGFIDQAHRPDEFIAVEQLEQCERALRRLALGERH